jgi:hypothetical protein
MSVFSSILNATLWLQSDSSTNMSLIFMSTLMSALEGRLCTWTECSALCVAGFVTGSSSGSL